MCFFSTGVLRIIVNDSERFSRDHFQGIAVNRRCRGARHGYGSFKHPGIDVGLGQRDIFIVQLIADCYLYRVPRQGVGVGKRVVVRHPYIQGFKWVDVRRRINILRIKEQAEGRGHRTGRRRQAEADILSRTAGTDCYRVRVGNGNFVVKPFRFETTALGNQEVAAVFNVGKRIGSAGYGRIIIYPVIIIRSPIPGPVRTSDPQLYRGPDNRVRVAGVDNRAADTACNLSFRQAEVDRLNRRAAGYRDRIRLGGRILVVIPLCIVTVRESHHEERAIGQLVEAVDTACCG